MNRSTLATFEQEIHQHLHGFYLPFWCGPALDQKNGGWMGWLSNDLTPDRTQPKGLIVNARILWAFSAAYRYGDTKNPRYLDMARRAHAFLLQRFWDKQHGGAFWRVDDVGNIIDDSKKIYGQAFVIYALSEYFLATNHAEALTQARALFHLVEQHAHDAAHGGYIEVKKRDWSEAGPEARLSDKDMNEKKSMNNHLHVLEAYTNLYRAWPDEIVASRLRELIGLFLANILDSRTSHLHHFFEEKWTVKSDSYTYGHDIEASWLLCEAAAVLRDARLISQVHAVALQMAEAVLAEGISSEGALSYEGRNGQIIDGGKECWPQAEAIVGFINAFELSGDKKFLSAALRVWNFAQANLVDKLHGEWFWRINPDGRPDATLPKVSEWKGPYHVTRACLESHHRIKSILSNSKLVETL